MTRNSSSLYLPTRPLFSTSCVEQGAMRSSLSRPSVRLDCILAVASRTKQRVYSLQLSWYSDRCGCLGINTARSRHESRTTFHIQCSERRCRTNYNSRKWHRHCRYMWILRFNVAERFAGTVGSHRTRQLSTNPWDCGCTWSRILPRTTVHP